MICLVTGVKMKSFDSGISSNKTVERSRKILDILSLKTIRPRSNIWLCFECARLLNKYEKFRSKCYRAQSILATLETEDAETFYKQIQNIDRNQNQLASNLSSSQTYHYDNYTPIINEDYTKAQIDNIDTIKTEIMEHKDLDELIFDDTIDFATQDSHNLDAEIQTSERKSKKTQPKFKRKPKQSKHSTEHESLSDDEPLANKVTRNSQDNKINNAAIPELKDCTKLGKRFKDFCDFEDYATVVFLTPEDAKKEVLLRKESSNYINSQFKCDLCYRGYEAKLAFDNHMKKHSIDYGEYRCDICQLRFPEQRYLCKHRLASHKRKFCCKICSYVCFCMHQAKTHVSLHKGKKYPCKECGEVFSMPNSLLMHKRQKHPTECVCELCGHTFVTPRGLYSHHMKLHRQHVNEKRGPKCEVCNKHFATEAAWKIHLVLSSKHNVSNGCKYCGETFSTSEELKCHMRVHARKHISRHLEMIPGHCSMKQCFLTYHQRKHSGERPYKCEECEKTFQLAAALSTHRAVHLNKRNHKCGVCARVFTFKSVLNKHMKIHLGIRPHRCDICDKSFISPCDVKVHIKYVHNKVPWPKRDKAKLTQPNYIQY